MNRLINYKIAIMVVGLLLASHGMAGEVVTLSTTVQGNQEHPSVTYIVPWRKAPSEDSITMPFEKPAVSNVFESIERVEHEREVDYLLQMQAGGADLHE